MENAFFVVDRTQLKSANDWLVSNVGSFEHRGSSAKVYTILNGKIVVSKVSANKRLEDLVMEDGQYWIKNVFHRDKKYSDFLRTSTTILDWKNITLVPKKPSIGESFHPHSTVHAGGDQDKG